MPILAMFYGIIVRMYYVDNKQHHVPHIHVEYGDDKAVFDIADGKVLAGKFPKTKLVSYRHGSRSAAKN